VLTATDDGTATFDTFSAAQNWSTDVADVEMI